MPIGQIGIGKNVIRSLFLSVYLIQRLEQNLPCRVDCVIGGVPVVYGRVVNRDNIRYHQPAVIDKCEIERASIYRLRR